MKKNDFENRFWSKVRKTDGCWIWTANKNNKGYGMFSINAALGKSLAHRVSFEMHNGAKIPIGVIIRHSCDTPSCVNPAHLLQGTKADNSMDMARRERAAHLKISTATAIAIRLDYIAGVEISSILQKHSVGIHNFNDIIAGRCFRHCLDYPGATLAELKAARRRTPGATITREQATEIKDRLAKGETGRSIARAYGIHFASVSDIKTGKTWKDA